MRESDRHPMNVSVMQPYLFPYLAYFQLMASADIFVIHDDVQFIKGGWINRNRILSSGEPRWITLPVVAGAHTLNINQRGYAPGAEGPRQFLRRLEAGYRAATNFAEVFEQVSALLVHEDRNVAAFNAHALRGVAESVGIATPLVVSSEMTSMLLALLPALAGLMMLCERDRRHRAVPPGSLRRARSRAGLPPAGAAGLPAVRITQRARPVDHRRSDVQRRHHGWRDARGIQSGRGVNASW